MREFAGRHLPLRRRRQHPTHIIRRRLIEYRLDAVDPTHRLLQPVQSRHLVLVLALQHLDSLLELRAGFSFGCDHLVGL
jgi:hypothetical protein